MPDRFDKFTERARKVLTLAQEEAQRFNHNYIGTEHLLLGLVREGDGVGAKVLANMGVELNKVRSEVEFIIGRGDQMVMGEIGLTPRAKKVIELAVDEARRLNHRYIGTEHLLLGLAREGEGIAAGVLESLGVSLDKVRAQVIHVLSGGSTYVSREPRQVRRTPMLDYVSTDVTAAARGGVLDPIFGWQKEIEHLLQILGQPAKSNPVMIGLPSSGSIAIVEGIAQRLVAGSVAAPLGSKRLVSLNMGLRAAGHPELSERRLRAVIDEIRASRGEIIAFVGDLRMLVGVGAGGAGGAAGSFRASLIGGELQCIGVMTLEEYRAHVEPDTDLERQFQPVQVGEPSVDETVAMLRDVRYRYEQHHGVEIPDDALQAAAELAARNFPYSFLPDKAIDLIDEAAARVRLQPSGEAVTLKEMMRRLRHALARLQDEKESAIVARQYEMAAELRGREVKLREEIDRLDNPGRTSHEGDRPMLTREHIARVVKKHTGNSADMPTAETPASPPTPDTGEPPSVK